jgi:hypothetical protein
MAIEAVNGIAVDDDSTINGISGLSEIFGIALSAGGGGGAAAFSDDFNRADADGLGANWTEAAGDGDIFSNTYRISSGSFANVTSVHNTSTGSLTQYVKVTITTAGAQYPWLVFRYTDGSSPYYTFQLDGNSADVSWYHFASAAASSGTEISTAVNLGGGAFSGQTLGITITGTGASTVVRLWRGCTGLPSAADNWNGDTTPSASWSVDPGGSSVNTGMLVGIGGQQSAADTNRLEDFFGGGL